MVLGSKPCLEGFLLSVLGESVSTTAKSKRSLAKLTGCPSVTRLDFERKFPRTLLNAARKENEVLDFLLEAVGKV